MKKIVTALAILALSVLTACAGSKNVIKDFGSKLKVEGQMVKYVYWPNEEGADDSVREVLDPKEEAAKKVIDSSAEYFNTLETKEVKEKPVLPQTDVVVAYEIDTKDGSYNVSVYKQGYVKYQDFKNNKKKVLQISEADVKKAQDISVAYQTK